MPRSCTQEAETRKISWGQESKANLGNMARSCLKKNKRHRGSKVREENIPGPTAWAAIQQRFYEEITFKVSLSKKQKWQRVYTPNTIPLQDFIKSE